MGQKQDRKALKERIKEGHGWSKFPSASYSILWLRAKKVICSMGAEVPQSEWRWIQFTFTGKDHGNWDIVVEHKKQSVCHILFKFQLTAKEVDNMTRAGK